MKRAALLALFLFATPAFAQPQLPPALLDGVALLGPPPAPGSPEQAADRAQEGRPVSAARLALASADQGPNQMPDMFGAFQSVMGPRFEGQSLPRTQRLLQATVLAIIPPMAAAKEHYARPRPYVAEPALARCSPAPTEALGPERSYPSGHSAIGYAWGLVLAEISPAHAQAALERGRDFGESRIICGVHWPSDVQAGRLLAASVVARLHANPEYRALLEDARSELVALN